MLNDAKIWTNRRRFGLEIVKTDGDTQMEKNVGTECVTEFIDINKEDVCSREARGSII